MQRNTEVHIEKLALFYMEKNYDVSTMSVEDFTKKFFDICEDIKTTAPRNAWL